jgi:Flp pilus assembly protein TadG
MLIHASHILRRLQYQAHALRHDARGLAAIEFAMILPLMAVLFFGTVEVTRGVAVDRKVTIVARTLSDLTSQASNVDDTQLANFFAASAAIMDPYPTTPVQATISQVKIDKDTLEATIRWSKGAKPHGVGQTVDVPAGLKPAAGSMTDTYLIWSEVSYLYKPLTEYTMTDVMLGDQAYTRPRQSLCVTYNNAPC